MGSRALKQKREVAKREKKPRYGEGLSVNR